MRAVILLFALSFSILLKAQDFAPVGATWTYTENWAFSAQIGPATMTCIADTTIEGIPCKKLNGGITGCSPFDQNNNYVYKDGTGKVFYYSFYYQQFYMLYDFGAAIGDAWSIPVYGFGWLEDTLQVSVVDTSSVIYNGYTLKTISLHFNNFTGNDFYFGGVDGVAIENLGLPSGFFPGFHMACDMNFYSDIRCYSDSIIGFIDFDPILDCNYFTTGVNDQTGNSGWTIFPNPVIDYLTVSGEGQGSFTISIFDSAGKLVLIQNDISYNGKVKLNLESLTKGYYFAKLSSQSSNQTFKIIKL